MDKIVIGDYVYTYGAGEWIVCGKILNGIDGDYIEWFN